MKNKGFTLIELLAVIVILAIIALIAVPIILNIIGDAKEKSNEIYNIVKNLQFYQYDYKEKYGGQKNNIGFLIDDIENTLLNDYLHIRKREDDKDFRNYNCEDLTRIILMIVQQLQNKIEKLESKN